MEWPPFEAAPSKETGVDSMRTFKGMHWWMVGLVTAGLIVNYLARNSQSVAATTMMKELSFSTNEYSYVVVAWQICYALMQPIAGYVLDTSIWAIAIPH
jgi:ACS family hexuronate transporter-like MFS transporter